KSNWPSAQPMAASSSGTCPGSGNSSPRSAWIGSPGIRESGTRFGLRRGPRLTPTTRPDSGNPGGTLHGKANGPGPGLRVRVADGIAAVASVRDAIADGAAAARGNGAGLVRVAGGDDRRAGADGQALLPVDGADPSRAGRPGGAGGDGRGDLPGQ